MQPADLSGKAPGDTLEVSVLPCGREVCVARQSWAPRTCWCPAEHCASSLLVLGLCLLSLEALCYPSCSQQPSSWASSDVVFFSCYPLQHFIWRIMPSVSRIFTVGVRHLFSFERKFKQLSSDSTDHSVCYLTYTGASSQLGVQLFMFF